MLGDEIFQKKSIDDFIMVKEVNPKNPSTVEEEIEVPFEYDFGDVFGDDWDD